MEAAALKNFLLIHLLPPEKFWLEAKLPILFDLKSIQAKISNCQNDELKNLKTTMKEIFNILPLQCLVQLWSFF